MRLVDVCLLETLRSGSIIMAQHSIMQINALLTTIYGAQQAKIYIVMLLQMSVWRASQGRVRRADDDQRGRTRAKLRMRNTLCICACALGPCACAVSRRDFCGSRVTNRSAWSSDRANEKHLHR